MRIKIGERTKVDKSVEDFIISTAKEKIHREAKKFNPRYVDKTVKQNALAWSKMANGDVDRIIGTMHGLPYKSIETFRHKGKWYLAGTTKEILMQEFPNFNSKRAVRGYDIGQYIVCIPQEGFLEGTYSGTHMIPVKDRLIWNRHPHHIAGRYQTITNPLEVEPSTCTGGFGGIALSLMKALDFAEAMRTWMIFLSRYNPSSPLAPLASFMQCVETY